MPERFSPGESVEVHDKQTDLWTPAIVRLSWAEVNTGTGARSFSYDVEGMDEMGPFSGRFDETYIRPATSAAKGRAATTESHA